MSANVGLWLLVTGPSVSSAQFDFLPPFIERGLRWENRVSELHGYLRSVSY